MNDPNSEASVIEALADETESIGQELAVREPAAAEITKYGPAAEAIEAEDLGIPRMMVGQPSSVAVQDGRVPAGAIYIAANAEDPEAQIVYKPGGRDRGVDVLPLSFLKGWCFRDEGDQFRVVPDGTEGVPQEADRVHTWLFCCPDFDPELPVSYLFKVSALPASQKIALAVKRSSDPSWTLAFRLTTTARQNNKGRWFVPQVVSIKPKPAQLEAAAKLAAELGIDGAAA